MCYGDTQMKSYNNPPARLFEMRAPGLPFDDIDDLDLTEEQLGKAIMTNYAAGQTAGKQAMERLMAAGRQLILAKSRGLNFTNFLRDHCNGLSRSYAYDLMAIANGKIDKVRANSKARTQRHRLRQRIATAKASVGSGTDTKSATRRLSVLEEFEEAVDVLFLMMDPETRQRAKSYVKEWRYDLAADVSVSPIGLKDGDTREEVASC
jgi:hypothetical protein